MKRRISLILIGVLLLSCLGCGGNKTLEKYTDYSFEFFDTVTTITGYSRTKAEFDQTVKDIKAEIKTYHRLFDIYNTYDNTVNLATVNSIYDGKHKPFKVDEKIIELLLFSKEMFRLTNGKTNVAMGSVLKIWHSYRKAGKENPKAAKLPHMEELKKASEHTNIDSIIIDQDKSTVFLSDPEMFLDVGAIAKGYTAEKLVEFLRARNKTGYIINLGGNVKTVGRHPNGDEFSVGIENPDEKDTQKPYIEKLHLTDKALVTSGSYQRYYTVGGKNYHHIIDPETLMPKENFASVSVICENSGMGDALSTALFNMEIEEGKKLIEKLDGAEALWVFNDKKVIYSKGFKEYVFK